MLFRYLIFTYFSFLFTFYSALCQIKKQSFLDESIDICKLSPKQVNGNSGLLKCMENLYFPNYTLIDVYGKKINLYDIKKEIILNFWFISCPPCQIEKKYLKLLANDNVQIISLALDENKELIEYISKNKLSSDWIYCSDIKNSEIGKSSLGYPLTILLGNRGKIRKVFLGGIGNENKLNELKNLLYKK